MFRNEMNTKMTADKRNSRKHTGSTPKNSYNGRRTIYMVPILIVFEIMKHTVQNMAFDI